MNRIASTIADERLSRRQFLKVAGAMGLSAAGLALLDACNVQPTVPSTGTDMLETTTIRIPESAVFSICIAPAFLAEEFLKAEGFTDVQYPKVNSQTNIVVDDLDSGAGDMGIQFSGPSILYLDAGKRITMLAGIHVGCFELFGTDKVNEIGDLKGKTIAVTLLGGPDHIFISSLLAYVNIDPNKDVTWLVRSGLGGAKQLFIDGKVDAYLAFPPNAQELRAKKIGHVLVNSMMDAPWSQYFCCMATFNRDFAQTKPVATKRALRALLKATDLCALHPEQAAKLMVDKGFTPNYGYALEALQEIPYNKWREFNPEDTIRFYSLLLHGVGMLKSSPDEIIKQGTDWHYLNELKTEMKA